MKFFPVDLKACQPTERILLALADLIGLDTCLSIMKVLQEGLGNKYTPCSLLTEYVKEGRLGKKVKKGFYTY